MNIVCFSYNAPPLNDSEAFCTARLLSALASEGIHVHLVSIEHACERNEASIPSLLDQRIAITRIRKNEVGLRSKAIEVLRYAFHGPHLADVGDCIAAVKRVLGLYENPYLITRAYPLISNVVGYHCRAYAAQWVAHFSDPCPGFGMYSRKNYWRHFVDRWWSRRIISRASLVTVTNRNAVRWFSDSLRVDLSPKMHVLYHIGFPHLTPEVGHRIEDSGVVEFVHVGYWSERRQLKTVLEEFRAANAAGPAVRVSQHGPMDPGSAETCLKIHGAYFSVHADRGLLPREASGIMAYADMNLVVDQDDKVGYCPYLASKFAYCVASGRPLLAIGQRDSEMAMLHAKYGGFYFADIDGRGDVNEVVTRIASTPRNEWLKPGEELRNLFRPTTVARGFLRRLAVALAGQRIR